MSREAVAEVAEEKPDQPPLMARVGRAYFEARSSRVQTISSGDARHVLNEAERKALRRVELGAIIRACIAGALSGGACALAEYLGEIEFAADPVSFWTLMAVVTIVASVAEIAYIYWETLRSVHELARVAGIELFGKDRKSSDDALVDALARAALELPNPVKIKNGVNPHREVKKWQLILVSLAYKAKVGVTNFVVKLIIRRMMSRVAIRGLLPFVAAPVTAIWNGIVMWMVLREARIRAMGPSAIEDLVDVIFDDAPQLSEAGKLSAVRAVASAIVRTQDLHPNLVRLLDSVVRHAGDTGKNELDDVGLFLSNLKGLTPTDLKVTLQVLSVACVVDGRLSFREKKLWSDALQASGRPVDYALVEQLLKDFVRGEGFKADVLKIV